MSGLTGIHVRRVLKKAASSSVVREAPALRSELRCSGASFVSQYRPGCRILARYASRLTDTENAADGLFITRPGSVIWPTMRVGCNHGAMAWFSAAQGLASSLFLLILFPGSPGIKKPHRSTDEAEPCQNRRIRLREQPTGENGIDDRSDKINVPRNLAFLIQRCVGLRCHSSGPMRLVRPNYVLSVSV